MSPRRARWWLASLLAVSYGLRVWLACLGGQGFWADEDRYTDGRHAAAELLQGQWAPAARELFRSDHTLFRWFSVPPGIFETLAGPHPALVASYFSLFSVLGIFLVWAVARRAGAGNGEALWAAYLAGCANCLFYYSRFFFPYDSSLALMLASLWLALGPWSWRNSLLAGAVAGAGFLTYNGNWLLGGCVLILHSLLGQGGRRRLAARAVFSGGGLLLAIGPVVELARILGRNLVTEGSQWGALVRGDFPFGHRVVAGYLWRSERGVLVIWLAAFAYALWRVARERRWGRMAWYAGGLGLVLGGLLLLSDVIPVFRIQGRQVRDLVPFLCLGAAFGLEQLAQRGGRGGRAGAGTIALLAGGCAAWNFSSPLRQVFPEEFQRRSARIIAGTADFAAYRLAFAESLWGLPLDPRLPSGPPLLRVPHPMQFQPYLYEGYDKAQRAEVDRHDISMRLYRIPADLGGAVRPWGGYPGPVRWSVILPSDRAGLAEPLVTSGRTGRADFLFVRYLDGRHLAFGLDHWGGGESISVPVEVDYAKPHEIVVSLGSLLPPAESGLDRQNPELARWRGEVLVVFDGRVVLHCPQAAWPSRPDQITLGVNLLGGSAAQLSFSGQLLKVDSAPAALVRSAMGKPAVGGPAEFSWIRDWHPGSVLEANRADDAGLSLHRFPGRGESVAAVSFRLPPPSERRAQPIMVFVRKDGALGLLATRRAAAGLEIGWRDEQGWRWSEPRVAAAGDLHAVELQWDGADGVAASPAAERSRRLAAMIMLDGGIYPHPRPEFFDVPASEFVCWRDPAPADSGVAPYFTGEVEDPPEVRLLPLVREGAPARRGFRLVVRFPADRTGRNEPLVIAGHSGAADGLYVHYERPGWVRIGFDHWGVGGPLSEPIPVLTDAYQILGVDLGAGAWGDPQGGEVRVSLDGRPVLRTPSSCYPVASAEVAIGRNDIHLSTSDPVFGGEIFPIEDADSRP